MHFSLDHNRQHGLNGSLSESPLGISHGPEMQEKDGRWPVCAMVELDKTIDRYK